MYCLFVSYQYCCIALITTDLFFIFLNCCTFSVLQSKEVEENAKAEKIRQQKSIAEESKKMTIEDLTKGMINYKYLCLDFEKAEVGSLRYVSLGWKDKKNMAENKQNKFVSS